MPSGVATAGEAGIEAALVGVLRRTRGAVLAVLGAAVVTVVTVVTGVVVLALLIVTVVTAASAVVRAVVAAELGIRVALVIRTEAGREAATASERASVATSEALVRSEASVSETVSTTASAGERRLLVPAEGAGDLLERAESGLEVFGAHGVGDLGPDAVDDAAEAVFGRVALVGERPAVAVGDDPSALDQAVQLVGVQRAARRRRAVDHVEDPPVSAACALAFEGRGELGRHEAVDCLDPEAEGARGAVCVLSVRGVHE